MKVLWFEISTPSNYLNDGSVTKGWQDSLERIVKTCPSIDLFVAFKSLGFSEDKVIDGVHYYPLSVRNSFYYRKRSELSYNYEANRLLPLAVEIVNKIRPDIIHVFGTEWPCGLICEYNNAQYPPGYSGYTLFRHSGMNIRMIYNQLKKYCVDISRERMERKIWSICKNYMGRTKWDFALANIMHPQCNYYHVDEALRPDYMTENYGWKVSDNNIIRLLTIGAEFRKGCDMILKTARILKDMGIAYEWKVAGSVHRYDLIVTERKEKNRFGDVCVDFLGPVNSESLYKIMCSSSLYIHTAYSENSPNSICEAQILGLPVISTNVGGISILITDGEDGILVPANDPWEMAYKIINTCKNRELLCRLSNASMKKARNRHKPDIILNDILTCYNGVIKGV